MPRRPLRTAAEDVDTLKKTTNPTMKSPSKTFPCENPREHTACGGAGGDLDSALALITSTNTASARTFYGRRPDYVTCVLNVRGTTQLARKKTMLQLAVLLTRLRRDSSQCLKIQNSAFFLPENDFIVRSPLSFRLLIPILACCGLR